MNKSLSLLTLIITLLLTSVALAHNKVVVIPLFGNDEPKPLEKTVITVAKVDGDFTDLAAALDFITDASETNPYRIEIAPGIYDDNTGEPIYMKPYIDVAGSGETVTKIQATITNPQRTRPVISLALNSTLSHLTVENTAATGTSITAISAYDLSNPVEYKAFSSKLMHVTAIAAGTPSSSSRGVHLEESSITITHVTARATGTYRNYGIRTYDSSPIISETSIYTCGGSLRNRALYINSSSVPMVTNSESTACGIGAYGVFVSTGGDLTIDDSAISGATAALLASTLEAITVTNSSVNGGISGTPSNFTCLSSHSAGLPLDQNCQISN